MKLGQTRRNDLMLLVAFLKLSLCVGCGSALYHQSKSTPLVCSNEAGLLLAGSVPPLSHLKVSCAENQIDAGLSAGNEWKDNKVKHRLDHPRCRVDARMVSLGRLMVALGTKTGLDVAVEAGISQIYVNIPDASLDLPQLTELLEDTYGVYLQFSNERLLLTDVPVGRNTEREHIVTYLIHDFGTFSARDVACAFCSCEPHRGSSAAVVGNLVVLENIQSVGNWYDKNPMLSGHSPKHCTQSSAAKSNPNIQDVFQEKYECSHRDLVSRLDLITEAGKKGEGASFLTCNNLHTPLNGRNDKKQQQDIDEVMCTIVADDVSGNWLALNIEHVLNANVKASDNVQRARFAMISRDVSIAAIISSLKDIGLVVERASDHLLLRFISESSSTEDSQIDSSLVHVTLTMPTGAPARQFADAYCFLMATSVGSAHAHGSTVELIDRHVAIRKAEALLEGITRALQSQNKLY